jgi:hypothetical protein
MRHGHA